MTKTTEKTPAVPHDLILESRSKLTLTGVKRVLRDRKSTRLNSSHYQQSRMPSSA